MPDLNNFQLSKRLIFELLFSGHLRSAPDAYLFPLATP